MGEPETERRGDGYLLCRLCRRWLPMDDMAVMAYGRMPSPPCCESCWTRLLSAAAESVNEPEPGGGAGMPM